MRSYLSIIAARAVRQPQPIRPRVASLFESSGPRMRLLEPISKKQVVQPRRANEIGDEQAEPAGVAKNIVGGDKTVETRHADTKPAAFEAAGRAASLQPESKPVSQQPPSPLIRVVSPQLESDGELTRAEQRVETADQKEDRSRPAAIQSELARTESPAIEIFEQTNIIESAPEHAAPGSMTAGKPRREPPPYAGVAVRPELVASESKASALEATLPSQETRQSIRITIGRVDVRAIMPQPATATNEIRKAATAGPMSLEEYLKKRNGALS